jgi:hypothetical protein
LGTDVKREKKFHQLRINCGRTNIVPRGKRPLFNIMDQSLVATVEAAELLEAFNRFKLD